MKIQATRKDITIESDAFIDLVFQKPGEDFTGLNIKLVISPSRFQSEPTLSMDQDDLTVEEDQIKASLSPDQTDPQSEAINQFNWFELWVEWQPGQWAKEFKGELTLTTSINYKS